MKDLIIITGTIVLGCFLFHLIAGEEDSLKNACAEKMVSKIEQYQEQKK